MKINLTVLFASVSCILFIAACTPSAEHRYNEQYVSAQRSVEHSAVLLNNSAQEIPLKNLEELKIASVDMGSGHASVFDSILTKYALVNSYSIVKGTSGVRDLDELSTELEPFNTLIIQLTDRSLDNPATMSFILKSQKSKQVILNLVGDVGRLAMLNLVDAPIIWSEKDSHESAVFAAQLIFGGVGAIGRLKQDVSPKYKIGAGFSTNAVRLKYSVPEDAGVNIADMKGIDKIAAEAIRKKAAPSIAVMVIKDNKVIFNKAYGTHSYTDPNPSKITDIYDLASLTKTSATTIAVMRLYEEGKIKLDTIAGAYIPRARKTNKNLIRVRDLMLHQAGLVPYIPFHMKLTAGDRRRDSSAAFPTRVTESYFLRKGYFWDVMWPAMLKSALAKKGTYVYSDLSMYFMQEIVERQSGTPLEDYVQTQFYQPLGMTSAGFNPRNRFEKENIIPTEHDNKFRKALVHGYVHDQGAAMAGGVAGHAGLFASTNDLAILYQMLLNGGSYGGKQYFKPETIKMFTAKQSGVSRRGLGFDRWDPKSKEGFPSRLASSETYGHTGYTGTCVWVDPKYDLIYIFLSNRVNPSVTNKLSKLNIRERIQDEIYEAILKGKS